MPDLDVTELLGDPDFCESVVVTRRAETVGANGRSSVSSSTQTVQAVVAPGVSRTFRLPEGQGAEGTVTVHTTFRLTGPANGYQPDLVQWRGSQYTVMEVNDYSHFGAGFVEALCKMQPFQEALNG